MHTEQDTQSRILISKKKSKNFDNEFIAYKSRSGVKGKKYKTSCKKGKLCGAKHIAICAETREKFRKGLILNFKRRDPFYMVDGIIVEEQRIDPVNTNSGVLFEEELKYLE